MTAATEPAVDQHIQVAGRTIRLLVHGDGDPLLVLHHSTGSLGWLPLYDALGRSFSVKVPDMPGYGQSERQDWARSPRDLAILMHQLLDRLELDHVHLLGLGFGGWVAAEMATMSQRRLASLVLVGAPGLRPHEGEIADQIGIGFEEYMRLGFRDDQSFVSTFGVEVPKELTELWDFSREMTVRLTWKPWMFSLQLPFLLTEVRTPALVVWGGHDRIVPLDCGRQYAEALPNSRLEVVENAGHSVDLEEPDALAALVSRHSLSLEG